MSPTTVTGNSRLVAFVAGDGTIGVSALNDMVGLSLQLKNAQAILPDVFALVKSITSCRLTTPPAASEFAVRFGVTDPLYWMCVIGAVRGVCAASEFTAASVVPTFSPPLSLFPSLPPLSPFPPFPLSPTHYLIPRSLPLSLSSLALSMPCRYEIAAPAPASLNLVGDYSDWMLARRSDDRQLFSVPSTCSFTTVLAGGTCNMQYTYLASLFGASTDVQVCHHIVASACWC